MKRARLDYHPRLGTMPPDSYQDRREVGCNRKGVMRPGPGRRSKRQTLGVLKSSIIISLQWMGGMTEAPPRTSGSAFVLTLVLVTAFSVFLVFNEDPWALGRFVVVGIAYIAAIVLSIVWFASPRRRGHAIILLVATLVMLGGVYSLSGGNGYPGTNVDDPRGGGKAPPPGTQLTAAPPKW